MTRLFETLLRELEAGRGAVLCSILARCKAFASFNKKCLRKRA